MLCAIKELTKSVGEHTKGTPKMATTRRTRTITKVASAGAGLGLAAVAVLGFSNAAFSATADNQNNNWAAGKNSEITLTPNQSATAPLFSFGIGGAPRPSSDGTQIAQYDGYLTANFADLNAADQDAGRSVTVTYKGRPAADVRMFAQYAAGDVSNALDQHTMVTVTRQGAAGPVWTGPLSAMPTSWDTASGASAWTIAPEAGAAGTSAKYTVTIQNDGAAVDGSAIKNVKFVWEARQA